jgi:hypothetical protein
VKYIFTIFSFIFFQEFHFKHYCQLRVFTAEDETFTGTVNLVAVASKYGLVFVGCPTGIQGMILC